MNAHTTVLDVREAIVIQPGDVLVLRVPIGTSGDVVKDIRDLLAARLGGRVADVIVVTAEQLAVIRVDQAAA